MTCRRGEVGTPGATAGAAATRRRARSASAWSAACSACWWSGTRDGRTPDGRAHREQSLGEFRRPCAAARPLRRRGDHGSAAQLVARPAACRSDAGYARHCPREAHIAKRLQPGALEIELRLKDNRRMAVESVRPAGREPAPDRAPSRRADRRRGNQFRVSGTAAGRRRRRCCATCSNSRQAAARGSARVHLALRDAGDPGRRRGCGARGAGDSAARRRRGARAARPDPRARRTSSSTWRTCTART